MTNRAEQLIGLHQPDKNPIRVVFNRPFAVEFPRGSNGVVVRDNLIGRSNQRLGEFPLVGEEEHAGILTFEEALFARELQEGESLIYLEELLDMILFLMNRLGRL